MHSKHLKKFAEATGNNQLDVDAATIPPVSPDAAAPHKSGEAGITPKESQALVIKFFVLPEVFEILEKTLLAIHSICLANEPNFVAVLATHGLCNVRTKFTHAKISDFRIGFFK